MLSSRLSLKFTFRKFPSHLAFAVIVKLNIKVQLPKYGGLGTRRFGVSFWSCGDLSFVT